MEWLSNIRRILKIKSYSVKEKDTFPDVFLFGFARQILTQVHCRGPPDSLFIRKFENKTGGENSGKPI